MNKNQALGNGKELMAENFDLSADGMLRKDVLELLEGYFKNVKIHRGLATYEVICDETNNTPETLAQGVTHITIVSVPYGRPTDVPAV